MPTSPLQRPLLPLLQGVIERTYGMPRLIEDAGTYLIGDRGLRSFYAGLESDAAHRGDGHETGARVLVRGPREAVRAALYYPDTLVRHLERNDPRQGIDDGNIDAFAILVEELDHLLVIASRSARRRPVTLLELELHAGVTKYLVVVHFLGRLTGRRRLSQFQRVWARHHLFGKYRDGAAGAEARYHEAARLAGRFVQWLDGLGVAERRSALLEFDRRGLADQVGFIERVA
jgi:hypothetical protein